MNLTRTEMRALTWHGKHDIRCESVPDPKIEDPRDAVIKVTACAICGSDLHLYNGVIPDMHSGDVLGHENMGEVMEIGAGVTNLKVGDRVVVPFTISCGECFFCKRGQFSGCERSNPSSKKAEQLWVTPQPVCLDIRTCLVATVVDKPNSYVCRLLMSDP